jgi:hypothetical protein
MTVRSALSALSFSIAASGCGGPQPAPTAAPEAGPTLPAPLEAGVSRVRALIDLPDEHGITEAFTQDFLAHIPMEKVQAVFLQVHAVAPCTLRSIVSTESATSGKVHLGCASGGEDVTISVEPAPPYKITLLLLKPSQ